MKTIVVLPLLAAILAGCAMSKASTRTEYGNFINAPVVANEKIFADDAAKQLVAVYPPALTRFDLQQVASDGFGYNLITQLRSHGYALKEHASKVAPPRPSPEIGTTGQAAAKAERLRLGYVVDLAGAPDLYRVTLLVGDQSLSRAYLARDGSVFPAGAWMRKE